MLNEGTLRDQVVVNLDFFQTAVEDLKDSFLALLASEVALDAFHQKLSWLALQRVIVATDEGHELVEVTSAVEECRVLLRVRVGIFIKVLSQTVQEDQVRSPVDCFLQRTHRVLQVVEVERRAARVDKAVHLGCIELPVAEPDDRNIGSFEQRVQHLQWIGGGLLSETDLVEENDSDAVAVFVLEIDLLSELETALDAERGRQLRTLVRLVNELRFRSPELVATLWALHVLVDEVGTERLGAAWRAGQDDRDVVEDGDGDEEGVLLERQVHCNSRLLFEGVSEVVESCFLVVTEAAEKREHA